MKNYGFKVILSEDELEVLFSNRDYEILLSDDGFTNCKSLSQLIGLNELGPNIGVKKYSIQVRRDKADFCSKIEYWIQTFRAEEELLQYDYKSTIRGSKDSPVRRLYDGEYLGKKMTVTGGPGTCILEAYEFIEKNKFSIAKVDLRHYKTFTIDNEQVISVRRKKQDSEIVATLENLLQFLSKSDESELKIELHGGDS